MYEIVYTNRMKRDAKLMKKRGKNLEKLVEVLRLLASGNPLPQKYKDHQLNWLLMCQISENELILSATATGSHSDLFGK